ncbi:MAG: flavodoxin family protein [Endomicrobium sp.]|jgi:flavodoxin|nr:flavodoxin family protein [Endomicrobium sp.]
MRILVVYSSLTGNTKMIAESVYGKLQSVQKHEVGIFPVESAPVSDGYDLIFSGFWADKGGADVKTKKYLEKIHNKMVALFFTLGAYPNSEHAENIFTRAKNSLPLSSPVLGHFKCMGKIDPKILEISTKAHGAMTPERAARIEEAKKHPDTKDCAEAEKFAEEILKKAAL